MTLSVGIIGGSIAGCAAAVALDQAGIRVTVLERSQQPFEERGAGIALPPQLVDRLRARRMVSRDLTCVRATHRRWLVRGRADMPHGRLLGQQPLVAELHRWGVLFAQLRRTLDDRQYVRGANVLDVKDRGDRVVVSLDGGVEHQFDLVIGADGYRSSIRGLIDPTAAPEYAGYPAWRGMVDESMFPDHPLADVTHTVGIPRGNAMFYLVPGNGGDVRPGHRSINWLLYDSSVPEAIALRSHEDDGQSVVDSVPPGGLSDVQVSYLHQIAGAELPLWHADVIRATPEPYAQNIFDLVLDRYVAGRVCVIGDAGSIARPHTGSGATKAVDDALCLADSLASTHSIEAALSLFEADRLRVGRQLAALGKRLGREQVIAVPPWQQLDARSFDHWLRSGGLNDTYFSSASNADPAVTIEP